MRKMLCAVCGLVALCLVLGDEGYGQNKPAQKKTTIKIEEPTQQEYAQIIPLKDITGKITYLDLGAGKVVLRLEFQHLEPNTLPNNKNPNQQQQNQLKMQQQLARDYQNILKATNPVQRQQRMQQFMQHVQQQQAKLNQQGGNQANLFKTVTVAKDFEFDLAEDLKAARVKLEDTYDDKGNPVQLTAEELKKRKDPVLPGYTAKTDEIQIGQTVKLFLGTRKAKKAEPKKDEPKDDEEKADPKEKGAKDTKPGGLMTTPARPFVRSVLIVTEADPALTKQPEKKKKKN